MLLEQNHIMFFLCFDMGFLLCIIVYPQLVAFKQSRKYKTVKWHDLKSDNYSENLTSATSQVG